MWRKKREKGKAILSEPINLLFQAFFDRRYKNQDNVNLLHYLLWNIEDEEENEKDSISQFSIPTNSVLNSKFWKGLNSSLKLNLSLLENKNNS